MLVHAFIILFLLSQLEGVTWSRIKMSVRELVCKASIDTALNPQDKARIAMLSSLGQFRLAARQLLPVAEESCPHK